MESWQEKGRQPNKNVAEETDNPSNVRQEENWCEFQGVQDIHQDFVQEKLTNQLNKKQNRGDIWKEIKKGSGYGGW